MSNLIVSFRPDDIDSLRERYPAALDMIFDCTRGLPSPSPDSLRTHVFDFGDGLRLVVCRERVRPAEIFLHLCASATPETRVWEKFVPRDPRGFHRFVEERFAELTGSFDMEFLGKSQIGVFHWFRKVDN